VGGVSNSGGRAVPRRAVRSRPPVTHAGQPGPSWCSSETDRPKGVPLVDTIAGSTIANLKELRPGSVGRSEIRILFVFDPWRSAILLVAGDKAGNWRRWYREAIPRAERLYETYLIDRKKEMEE
jgi:hypothetical protein